MNTRCFSTNSEETVSIEEAEKVIVLTGHLGGVAVANLNKHIESLRSSNYMKIVLDLQAVTFADSSALGGLIYAHRILEKVGKKLVLVKVSDSLRELLHNCSFDGLLEIS
jgi:anti-sigma B factor antagonist